MRLACLAVVVSLLMAASASAAPRPGASGRNYKKVCGAVAAGLVRCHAELVTDASGNPLVTPAPAGYGPGDLQSAYGLAAQSATAGGPPPDAPQDESAATATAASKRYGGRECLGETASNYEGHYNHPGVAITVSSGDNGYGVEFPAASRYVTAVGGTTLVRDSSPRGWGET